MRVFSVEGKQIGEFGEERRNLTPFKDIPTVMVNAVLAIEDARFYQHGGLDYIGLLRASLAGQRLPPLLRLKELRLYGGVLLGWLALLLPDRRSAPAQTDRTKSLTAHAVVQRRHRLSSAGISHGGRQHAQTAKLVDTESARLAAYSLPCCFKLSPTRRICCRPRASVVSLVCTECGPSTNG